MDSQEQLFFDDYFSLFPALEDDQIHSPLADLSSNEFLPASLNNSPPSSLLLSSKYPPLSLPEADDEFIPTTALNHPFNSVVPSRSSNSSPHLSTFSQPLYYRKVEPVINHSPSNNTSLPYHDQEDSAIYMKELSVNSPSPPPLKIFHILENGVIPKENVSSNNNNNQINSVFNMNDVDSLVSTPEEQLLKKKRRRPNRLISKDLNAPSSNPVDIIDHREILTGAVLKPSSITFSPLASPFPAAYETHLVNPPTTSKQSVSVIPLKSPPPPVNSQPEISINFSREELLQISSDDYEEHVRQLSALRPLSSSERNMIKRQRRLIKNRESAQASRQRKKDYVGDLEKKVGDLFSSNAKLKEEYSSLTAENRQLKNEVEFLSDLVGKVKVSEV